MSYQHPTQHIIDGEATEVGSSMINFYLED